MPDELKREEAAAPVSLEAVLGSTRDGYWQCDLGTGLVYCSARLRELLGHPAGVTGNTQPLRFLPCDAVHPDDGERVARDYEQMVERRSEGVSHEFRLKTNSGGWLWVQGRSRVLQWGEDGRPKLMCGWISDVSRRRQLEQVLGTLLDSGGSSSLQDKLRDAVVQLTGLLGARFGHIGRLSEDGRRIRTLAVVRDGKVVENYEYDLAGSPCAVAIRESICAYPRELQAAFPEDQSLVELNVESYLGVVLRSRRKQPMGVLAAMGDRPLEWSEIPAELITLLAERLARELELEEAEDALQEEMRRSHSMFEHAIDGLGLLRERRGADGRIEGLECVVANPALRRHLGGGCDGIAGADPAAGTTGWWPVLLEMVRSLESGDAAVRQIQQPEGRWFEVKVYRQAENMAGLTVRDITAWRAGDEAVKESERRMRVMLSSLSQAALVLDVSGTVIFANRAALELVGGEEGDVLGSRWFEQFVPLDERLRIEAVLTAVGGLANCPPCGTNRILRLDGTERLVEWDLQQLTGPSGQVEAVAAVGRDITQARQLAERARLSQRMDAVGRLAGGVAHDFNNLLTVINGYVRMAMGKPVGDVVRGHLMEIERAGAKATELTKQLLALSRKQVMHARDFEVHETIRSMEPLLARLLGTGIFLDLELAASNDWIHFDPNAVEQALLTLTARARDVAHEGGAVKLSTACVTGPQAVQGGVLPESGYLRLRFEDDGAGMTDESIARLFEPFSDATAGLRPGLELATVYGALSQGGGGVSVESGDWGTRFDLYFRSAPPRAADGPRPVRSRLLSSLKTVLLVEDQEQVRAFTADVLRDAGMTVLAVGDAGSALSALAQSSGEIGLLLTDVVMPGLSGWELAVQARRINPRLPVVFMSGFAEAGPSAEDLEAIGAQFLQKPFTPDQLESTVRAELGKGEPARIVVADDDAGVRAFLRSVLESGGYSVAEACDGAAAIHELRSQAADMLITDLVMPGQEGIETIRTARREWPQLRIVAISGAFFGQFLRTAEVLGAKAVLQKPIRPDELLKAVREVLQS